MRLKKLYASREVAALTGLSARQLQWWDRTGFFSPSVPPRRTAAGGFTERRYTPVDAIELMVLADLRRRGFSIARLRRLLGVLKARFKVRLYEAIEAGGPITLFADGLQIYARAENGSVYNVLDNPSQPLLMLGEDVRLRQLTVRDRGGRKRGALRGPGGARDRSDREGGRRRRAVKAGRSVRED